jgi:hypothetical protein
VELRNMVNQIGCPLPGWHLLEMAEKILNPPKTSDRFLVSTVFCNAQDQYRSYGVYGPPDVVCQSIDLGSPARPRQELFGNIGEGGIRHS